ncbi:MAG TPA: nicotinate phosphoribosyltransferase, partial [Anaeromyxobacteraceae bacterium]
VLLVDTYDTLSGVREVVRLSRELGPDFCVTAVRLDSGNLLELSRATRRILDEAGLSQVGIFASGGLDERAVDRLVRAGAPIGGFGVGTAMGVSEDAPALDVAYKLVSYDGLERLKLSPGKELLPGPKQVFRVEREGRAERDVLGRRGEELPGRPLLVPAMRGGRRLPGPTLAEEREHARRERERLPERILSLDPADPPYPVQPSEELLALRDKLEAEHAGC